MRGIEGEVNGPEIGQAKEFRGLIGGGALSQQQERRDEQR
jgi:hypothetical protein